MLHFPMYSYSEMCALRNECFSRMDEKTMDERYAVWGGNPRSVMTMAHVSIEEFESEIRSFDYSSLARTVCNVDGNVSSESVSHRMMHIKIAGETDGGEGFFPSSLDFYKLKTVEFASRFVSAIVYERICDVRNEELLALIDGAGVTPGLSGIRGPLFEQEAIGRILAGGTFSMRRLGDDKKAEEKEMQITFPKNSKQVVFRDIKNLLVQMKPQTAQHVFLPTSKTFCSIDLILPGGYMANATVNRHHPLTLRGSKHPGALDIACTLQETLNRKSGVEIPFYWLVPGDVYNDRKNKFSVRPPRYTSSIKQNRSEKAIVSRIVQYIVHIDTKKCGVK